ncbi:MAG: hypothetical protein ACYS30_14425 [Planctomycetota bacterium]
MHRANPNPKTERRRLTVRRFDCDVHSRYDVRPDRSGWAFVAAGQGTYYDPLGERRLCDECLAGISAAYDETPELEEPERSLAIRHPPEK